MAVAFCAGVFQVTRSTPGSPFPLVLRHSSHRQRLGAERVSQQVLQGAHLAPPARLYGLHETGLEPAHDPVGASPVNGVPLCRVVGDRTSTPCRWRGRCCRHLRCLLSRLLRCSRDERPDGSLPAFAWGHVADSATPIPPITGRPSLFPASSTRSAIGGPYGTRSLAGALRAYQVPPPSPNGDGALFPPVVLSAHVTGHVTP